MGNKILIWGEFDESVSSKNTTLMNFHHEKIKQSEHKLKNYFWELK